MLISHKHEFIVGLPTKCGTNSMRNMAINYNKRGTHWDELYEIKELRHRMDIPVEYEHYTRAIVVRNPFARVVSMYEYLRRHSWEWKNKDILEAESRLGRRKAWTWFLNMLVDEQVIAAEKDAIGDGYWRRKVHGRRPYIWTDTMSQLMRFMGGSEPGVEFPWEQAPVTQLRLEHLNRDWSLFTRSLGWQDAPMPKRNNATRGEDKLHSDGVSEYFATEHNRHLGLLFVGEDRDVLPYGAELGAMGDGCVPGRL